MNANSSSATPTASTPGASSIRLAMPSRAAASTAQIARAITLSRYRMPSPSPMASSRGGGPLDYGNRRARRRPAADDPKLDGGPDAFGPEPLHDVAHIRDGRPIPRGQHVTEHQACACGRSVGINTQHDNPHSPWRRERLCRLCVQSNALHPEADIAARNAAFREKLIRDAIDRRRRDRENAPPRTRHHDAHRFSGGVDESPTFCCWVEPEVEADEADDGATADAPPPPRRGAGKATRSGN